MKTANLRRWSCRVSAATLRRQTTDHTGIVEVIVETRKHDSAAPDRLVAAILEFLGGGHLRLEQVRAALVREIQAAGPDAVLALQERIRTDLGWAYHAPDPLARRIHHLLADQFLQPGSRVIGVEHLAAVGP